MSSSKDILGEVECHSFEETTFRKKFRKLSPLKKKNAMRPTEKNKVPFFQDNYDWKALIYILIIVKINECI